jgi:hypothetical protein
VSCLLRGTDNTGDPLKYGGRAWSWHVHVV